MSLPLNASAPAQPKTAVEQLSVRDRALLDAFFQCRTATDAVRRVYGDKAKRPDVIASKWRAKPLVKQAIEERRQQILEAVDIRPEQIVREIGLLAFGDIRELFDDRGRLKPMHELTADQAALIASLDSDEIFGVAKQSDMFGAESTSQDDRVVIGLAKKFKRWDKLAALRELKEIAGLGKGPDASTIFNLQINL